MLSMPLSAKVKIAARSSPLSRAQVEEIHRDLRRYHPTVEFEKFFIETCGDKGRATSLRTIDKTDFFTKEVDELLLSEKCSAAIHSAKDLPGDLPKGLEIASITAGVSNADVLVLRPGDTIDSLPSGA